MDKQELTLFVKYTCPYCKKVLNFMEENDIDICIKDVTEQDNKQYLIENGGKSQVPCLFISSKPLYESNDIIEWFKENI